MKVIIYDNNASAERSDALRKFAIGAKENGHDVLWRNPNPFQPGMEVLGAELVVLNTEGDRQAAAKKAYEDREIAVCYFASQQFRDLVDALGDPVANSPELADAKSEIERLNQLLAAAKAEIDKLNLAVAENKPAAKPKNRARKAS